MDGYRRLSGSRLFTTTHSSFPHPVDTAPTTTTLVSWAAGGAPRLGPRGWRDIGGGGEEEAGCYYHGTDGGGNSFCRAGCCWS